MNWIKSRLYIDNISVNRYNVDMTFNDLLIQKNMSVYRLSKESGVAKTTLFDIASGKSDLMDCNGGNLLKIARTLKMSIEDILSLDKEPYNPLLEQDLPSFLDESIKKLKRKRRTGDPMLDCYYDEVNSSINVCETEKMISVEQADYLRKKYL